MKPAHFQYYLAAIEAACQSTKSAQKRWAKVSGMKEALPSPEFVFPILAAARIHRAEARPKIAAAMESVRTALAGADAVAKPGWLYLESMLLRANGEDEKAAVGLQDVTKMAKDTSLMYLALVEIGQIWRLINRPRAEGRRAGGPAFAATVMPDLGRAGASRDRSRAIIEGS